MSSSPKCVHPPDTDRILQDRSPTLLYFIYQKVRATRGINLVKELRYSDETHFHVDSKSMNQKFGFWPHGKSDLVAEAPLSSARRMRHDH